MMFLTRWFGVTGSDAERSRAALAFGSMAPPRTSCNAATTAYGLWKARAWAEWLAAISGSIYIPFEIYELTRGATLLQVVTFSINVVIVAVMVRALLQRRANTSEVRT